MWDTHPRAKRSHGADPNAPREPAYYGVHVRRAARIVDVLLGANVGVLESAFEETESEVSERLFALTEQNAPLRRLIEQGIEAVYDGAHLSDGEREVVRYQHEGMSHSTIATVTSRQVGTVQQLLARAHYKLRLLAVLPAEVAA